MEAEPLEKIGELAPDLMEELVKRSLVLERIAALEPIGRRALAGRLNMPEREVRAISGALRDAGHIRLDASGMTLTQQGQALLHTAQRISHGVRAIAMQEATLARLLGVARVVIVQGNAEKETQVLEEVGRQAALHVRTLLRDGAVLTVTGGSTMAQVARSIPQAVPMDVLVLPARGGMGRAVEIQAGTLAARMAAALGGHHRLLHVPDQLSASAREELLKVPEIREVVDMLAHTDVLMHGIGRADKVAMYRRMDKEAILDMLSRGAIAEAFGYYFDIDGRIVDFAGGLGLERETLDRVHSMAAVAAGESKAEAIIAVLRAYRHELLVTDESAARRMIAILTGGK